MGASVSPMCTRRCGPARCACERGVHGRVGRWLGGMTGDADAMLTNGAGRARRSARGRSSGLQSCWLLFPLRARYGGTGVIMSWSNRKERIPCSRKVSVARASQRSHSTACEPVGRVVPGGRPVSVLLPCAGRGRLELLAADAKVEERAHSEGYPRAFSCHEATSLAHSGIRVTFHAAPALPPTISASPGPLRPSPSQQLRPLPPSPLHCPHHPTCNHVRRTPV